MKYAKTNRKVKKNNYIESGKWYEVSSETEGAFRISGNGIDIYCLKKDCAHTKGGNWTFKEIKDGK